MIRWISIIILTVLTLSWISPRVHGQPLIGDDDPSIAVPTPEIGSESIPETSVPAPIAPATAVRHTLTVVTTAYCLRGTMRNGMQTHHGAVATDPSVIPLGTRLRIVGLSGEYYASDTGGGVWGNHVDIWMDSCEAAIQWGRQTREVEILN